MRFSIEDMRKMGIPVLSEILSEIERLIIEHGSAAVLYERLAFAKEQYKATEQQLQESQAKNGELADENRQLRKENDELKRKVAEEGIKEMGKKVVPVPTGDS